MMVVPFLTGSFAYASELQSFMMAIQGSMTVRNGANKDNKLHWFHAFLLSVLCGYGGSTFGLIWMGLPSSMLSNDLNFSSCILAFILVNYLPRSIGYKLFSTLPFLLVITSFSQLFRTLGLVKFATVAFNKFKDNPSKYYPIPFFGPVVYATMLSNMGGFFINGFHGYLKNGMPWNFQNGLFCASFFHFFVHDSTGFVGVWLRYLVGDVVMRWVELDNFTFGLCCVSGFMQVMGILRLPLFLGPKFSPFNLIGDLIGKMIRAEPLFYDSNRITKTVPKGSISNNNTNSKGKAKNESKKKK